VEVGDHIPPIAHLTDYLMRRWDHVLLFYNILSKVEENVNFIIIMLYIQKSDEMVNICKVRPIFKYCNFVNCKPHPIYFGLICQRYELSIIMTGVYSDDKPQSA